MKKAKAQPKPDKSAAQLERFKSMAEEVDADMRPDSLGRAFGRINLKKRLAKPK